MEEDKELTENFKEAFLRLSESIIDPKKKKDNEFDLGITFDEQNILQFEEEQEIEEMLEDTILKISDELYTTDEEIK